MKRKHVTLVIVWDEYIAANPGGYSYSRFCELYRGFESKLSPTMRQTHAAGERLFVDYAGDGVAVVIDRLTGEVRKAQINELGEWVLATACAEAATWPDHIKIAVNVSPVQFRSSTLALKIAAALALSGLPASRLELEITEAVLIRDDEASFLAQRYS